MDKILVIGYGNSLAGDDALGFYTVNELLGTVMPENISVKYIHQLMPEHSLDFTNYDKLIFIDAEASLIPGELKYRKIFMEDLKNTAVTAHEFTLDTILLMGYWLYGKMPEIHLLTVTGTNFETGENITPAVKSRIPEVIDMIFSIINQNEAAVAGAML